MDMEIFVQNVKFYCSLMGVKPTTACRKSGAGERFLENVKRGSVPSVEKVQSLAVYLRVTVSDLLGETAQAQPKCVPDWFVKYSRLSPGTQREIAAFVEFKAAQELKADQETTDAG